MDTACVKLPNPFKITRIRPSLQILTLSTLCCTSSSESSSGVVCVNCTCALVPCKLASSSPSNNKFQSNIALYLYLTRKSLKPTALEAPPLYKNNFKLYSGSSTVALGKPMGSMARTIRDANLNKLSTYSSNSSPGSQGTCLLPRLKLPSEGLVTASFQ